MINKNAVTLIELMVVMGLILILFSVSMSSSGLLFSSERQKLEGFTNSVSSEIDMIRINALIGKGIGANFVVPDSWKIDFSKKGSGSIVIDYHLEGEIESNRIDEFPKKLKIPEGMTINRIICNSENIDLSGNEVGTIIFEKGNYKLSGNCIYENTLIEIEFGYKEHTNIILFNTINGLIERKK